MKMFDDRELYIVLNDEKQATHSFKDGGKNWNEVCQFPNIARIVPSPYVVLDFDDEQSSQAVLNLIDEENLKVKVMRTTRGIHVYFKHEVPMKCLTHARTYLGISCDCKSHSKHAYTVIRQGGKDREWIRGNDLDWDDIQELPFYFSMTKDSHRDLFLGMKCGDSRNQTLFNYILFYQRLGLTHEQIEELYRLVNKYVFAEQLSDNELASILREDAFKDELYVDKLTRSIENVKPSAFDHALFSEVLLDTHEIMYYNNEFYEFNGKIWECISELKLHRYILDLCPNSTLKTASRNEVIQYLKATTYVEEIKLDKNHVVVQNGRLNLDNFRLEDFDSKKYDFNMLPITYNPNIGKNAVVDNFLNKVFCERDELIELFKEMLGSTILKHNRYQRAFVFVGKGSNGKSTLLEMIKAFLGTGNYSDLDIGQIADRFSTQMLENKFANIGDDCNNVRLKDTGVIKKVFAGQEVMVEKKGQDGYNIVPYATHFYSANELIKSTDKTEGFYRRFLFVPMTANIKRTDKDFDVNIIDKLTTDEALSYLLNLALDGITQLELDDGFIEPAISEILKNETKEESDTVRAWIADTDLIREDFVETPQNILYIEYTNWCSRLGQCSPQSNRRFTNTVKEIFNFDKLREQLDGNRYFTTIVEEENRKIDEELEEVERKHDEMDEWIETDKLTIEDLTTMKATELYAKFGNFLQKKNMKICKRKVFFDILCEKFYLQERKLHGYKYFKQKE